jgi:hypothetical protein
VPVLLQLLGLQPEAVRALVLRQPSLLARTTEGLAGKVDAYAEMFGRDSVGKVRMRGVVVDTCA